MSQPNGHTPTSTPTYNDHFTISNIPFGVVSTPDDPKPQIATRLYGDVFLIPKLLENGLLGEVDKEVHSALLQPTLNHFASLGRPTHRQIRQTLQTLLQDYPTSTNQTLKSCSLPYTSTTPHLPIHPPDFTDFSCSKTHVLNAGEAVTGRRALPPGFPYFPVGYGGRCSSIVVSGTEIRRPRGQFMVEGGVVFEESQAVDFELEVAVVVGRGSRFGESVRVEESEDHVFGFVLLNDWSARDIQSLEMPPLGPFLGKSFGTTISPWIITIDALEPFRYPSPPKDPNIPIASYLQQPTDHQIQNHNQNQNQHQHQNSTFAIQLQVTLETPTPTSTTSTVLCTSHFESLYWTTPEMIAHQTVNGCPLSPGDLLATGTISEAEPGSQGCLLEITMGGKREVKLRNGETRRYLGDGDAVRLEGWAGIPGEEGCVGFGECVGVLRGR